MPPHRPKGHGKPKNIKQTVLRILSYIKGYRLLMAFALLCITHLRNSEFTFRRSKMERDSRKPSVDVRGEKEFYL